jgi:hypothetical protein
MRKSLLTFLFFASTIYSYAEMRSWKNTDGSLTLQGEFIKRNETSVTIRDKNQKEITIPFTKLHADDVKWLDANHSLNGPVADPNAFFDNLTFQDTRESVTTKLKASKLVEMTTDETFIGRTGLNGIFKTRKKVGGLTASIYFDWSDAGNLKELNLQTDALPLAAYKTQLEPCWNEFIELLTSLYGAPKQRGAIPPASSLTNDAFFPSHYWELTGGGAALLGTARQGSTYQVVVRFSAKKPTVVEIR